MKQIQSLLSNQAVLGQGHPVTKSSPFPLMCNLWTMKGWKPAAVGFPCSSELNFPFPIGFSGECVLSKASTLLSSHPARAALFKFLLPGIQHLYQHPEVGNESRDWSGARETLPGLLCADFLTPPLV